VTLSDEEQKMAACFHTRVLDLRRMVQGNGIIHLRFFNPVKTQGNFGLSVGCIRVDLIFA
jgi:hypothetical protein